MKNQLGLLLLIPILLSGCMKSNVIPQSKSSSEQSSISTPLSSLSSVEFLQPSDDPTSWFTDSFEVTGGVVKPIFIRWHTDQPSLTYTKIKLILDDVEVKASNTYENGIIQVSPRHLIPLQVGWHKIKVKGLANGSFTLTLSSSDIGITDKDGFFVNLFGDFPLYSYN